MQYLMAPLEEHYDDGFGAVGVAFKEAAEVLAEASEGKHIFWNHLPEIFLLRHAIELFLKSGIIIMHRKLQIPYGSEPHTSAKPMLLTSTGNWKSLFGTHSLSDLYAHWKKLITENKGNLTAHTTYKPDMSVPEELDAWIDALGEADPNSDYFRYPISKKAETDKEKSSFKEVPVDSLFPSENKDKESVMALVTKNADGEWVRAFKLDESPQRDIAEAARNAAKVLNDFHAMMRIELTAGW
jgi:hypothetical protein